MSFDWMHWTWPTAAFFIWLFASLAVMTVWDIYDSSVKTQGFLPIAFTRGERFFIAIVIAIGVMLLWIGLTDLSLWYGIAIALILDVIVARWG
jgi:predicted small integral membrane protein